VPEGLALACAAHLALRRQPPETLADAGVWGARLDRLPGFVAAATRWMLALERDGIEAVLAHD
jgi:hypothetical protein